MDTARTPERYRNGDDWEARRLGADEAHIAVSDVDEEAIDAMVGLQQVSLCIPSELASDLDQISRLHGLTLQGLISRVLSGTMGQFAGDDILLPPEAGTSR